MRVDKKKLVEYLKCIPSAMIPEIINLMGNAIGGNLGIILPFIGHTVLNLKSNIEVKESIEKLNKEINLLSLEQQENVIEELRKICTIQIKNILNSGISEVYTIDCIEIKLRNNNEDYNSISKEILLSTEDENSLLYEFVDTVFVNENNIVIALLEPEYRHEINLLIDEIDNLIKEVCDTLWNRSVIKKITFY